MNKGVEFVLINCEKTLKLVSEVEKYKHLKPKVVREYYYLKSIKYTGNMYEHFLKYKNGSHKYAKDFEFLDNYGIISNEKMADYLKENYFDELNNFCSIDDLIIGSIYSNNEIASTFKCSNMGGMRRSIATNSLVLIAKHVNPLYDDQWTEEGILNYTGMGTIGDQSISFGQNKTLATAKQNNIKVYLFESYKENEYYLRYPDSKLNLICEETSEMFKKLKNKELDIVFSKKSKDIELNGILYIKLGNLHDVIVANKNSDLASKELTIEDLENNIIYCPRDYAQAVYRIKNLMNGRKLDLRNSSYNTILELSASGKALGLVTREYVTKEEYIKYNLVELKTEIDLGKIEFGIYLNNNRFKELNNLIEIIKSEFKV